MNPSTSQRAAHLFLTVYFDVDYDRHIRSRLIAVAQITLSLRLEVHSISARGFHVHFSTDPISSEAVPLSPPP